jgi:hypothetical protein
VKRHGAVVVFKPGVTREQAARALASISDVLDFPKQSYRYVSVVPKGPIQSVTRPFKPEDAVHEYEDEHGSPVWYIP